MQEPLFGFETPTYIPKRNGKNANDSFTFLNVYPDGSLSSRYYSLYKNSEWRPINKRKDAVIDKDCFSKISGLLEENKDFFGSFIPAHRFPREGQKQALSMVYVNGDSFFIPDYVLDPNDTTYLPRYEFYPDKDVQKAYLLIREIIVSLSLFVDTFQDNMIWEGHRND